MVHFSRGVLFLCLIATDGIAANAQMGSSAKPATSLSTETATREWKFNTAVYRVRLLEKTPLGDVPALEIYRNEQLMFRLPLVSGLDSATNREHLSNVHLQILPLNGDPHGAFHEIVATASSSLWKRREFHWRFFEDHLEFDQIAWGAGNVGRCYFFSNGIPGRWDQGQSDGAAWNSLLMADRYWSPSPNHAGQWEFSISIPQTLGLGSGASEGSDDDFRPAQMTGLFSPPPLMLAFHRSGEWAGIGIGATPGQYRFPALEYSGSRYAGAAWWVDYLGYQTVKDAAGGEFHSPTLAIHFEDSPLGALEKYTEWMQRSGYGTQEAFPDFAWHHLPIFCGWAEQTARAVPKGRAPSAEATQKNYEEWMAELRKRELPVGTVIIDDKWQKGYGSFEVDPEKWPDLKGFVAAQHAQGRHVLLWVPVARTDGLPDAYCVHDANGKCVAADLANPGYEKFLREQIRYLIETLGVDGFKEDWVWTPDKPGWAMAPELTGIEYPRRFQQILYSEAHRWKPDAMVETQTPNVAFRDSSDVLRLNDIWYATRDVAGTMRERARVAHISGWPLVDADNASSTTLESWWQYMEAQPSIGIPALYFVYRTEATQEEPADWQWVALAGIWRRYIAEFSAQ